MKAPEPHEMIPAERRVRIVELLEQRRAVRVSLLSEDLGVSEMTIRRDLERLAEEGILSRTHGGAILKRRIVKEPLYVENVLAHTAEKQRIAERAAAMIEPGDSIFLSSGTTAAEVLRHVDPQLEARVITHNVGAVTQAQGTRLELILLGGVYNPRSNAVEGSLPAELIGHFRASKMFISADGFDLEEGLTTPSIGMASIEREMIQHTRGEVIALADRSKVGVVGDVIICTLDHVHVVIADDGVEEDIREEIQELGLRCVVV